MYGVLLDESRRELLQTLDVESSLVFGVDGENLLGIALGFRNFLVEVSTEHEVVQGVLQHGVLALGAVGLVAEQVDNLLVVGLGQTASHVLIGLVDELSALVRSIGLLHGELLANGNINVGSLLQQGVLSSLIGLLLSERRVDVGEGLVVVDLDLGLASQELLIVLAGVGEVVVLRV